MTKTKAMKAMSTWVEQRLEVRAAVIKEARRLVKKQIGPLTYWPGNDERKLFNFPNDLSEARLLKIIDKYSKGTK